MTRERTPMGNLAKGDYKANKTACQFACFEEHRPAAHDAAASVAEIEGGEDYDGVPDGGTCTSHARSRGGGGRGGRGGHQQSESLFWLLMLTVTPGKRPRVTTNTKNTANSGPWN